MVDDTEYFCFRSPFFHASTTTVIEERDPDRPTGEGSVWGEGDMPYNLNRNRRRKADYGYAFEMVSRS